MSQLSSDLQKREQRLKEVEDILRKRDEATQALKDKLQKALGEEVPKIAEQAHARHILVEMEDEAKSIIERLKKGEDFY